VSICFICRELPGNLIDYIQTRGYPVCRLPYTGHILDTWLGEDYQIEINQTLLALTNADRPDLLIVDHYALDIQWERKMRSFANRIMVIDDLADRSHDCDILLDQNLYRNMRQRYEGLVSDRCLQLLGPQYVLLRPEFFKARRQVRLRDGRIDKIIVFFGGSDPSNETEKALTALKSVELSNLSVDVVVGKINNRKERIRKVCADVPNFTYHCQVENMADLMGRADLSIGAGGTTTWERCLLGLPAITVTVADNQRDINEYLNELGVVLHIGDYNMVTSDDILEQVFFLKNNPEMLKTLSERALSLMIGCTEQAIIKYF